MHFKSGEGSVSKEDMKRFAAQFDPQPFHLDEAAAEKTAFKGLAASGWHTAAISMGLAVEVRPDVQKFRANAATSPSPSVLNRYSEKRGALSDGRRTAME